MYEDFSKIHLLNAEEIATNFKYLGQGLARKVFAISEKYVVKVAKNNAGILQNKVEYYVYTHAEQKYLKYFCPMVWFGESMVVMKRAIPLSSIICKDFADLRELRKEKTICEDFNILAKKFYLYYKDLIDTSSWGIYDGENVLIDYGCTTNGSYYRLNFSENSKD